MLDLTANPDFSQVESDEPQTTVNRRFEVFFPERRAFFIENASYFETPMPVLFTRRIQAPRFGARFSGKAGKYAIGTLVADDAADEDASEARTLTSVIRASRDLAADSQVGVIYAGRTGETGGNHVAGVDGRLRLGRNVVTEAQAVSSLSSAAGAQSSTGVAYRARLDASGQRYVSSLVYTDASPGFRASMGFIPRTDVREVNQTTRIVFRPAGGRVTAWGPTVTLGRLWDHQGEGLDANARLDLGVDLPRQTRVAMFRSVAQERLRPQDSTNLTATTSFVSHNTGVTFGSAPFAGLVFNGEYARGTAINLSPARGAPPRVVASRTAAVTIGVRTAAFTMDTAYLWTRLGSSGREHAVLNDHLVRSRWNYQLSRGLSARAIVRYQRLNRALARGCAINRRTRGTDQPQRPLRTQRLQRWVCRPAGRALGRAVA